MLALGYFCSTGKPPSKPSSQTHPAGRLDFMAELFKYKCPWRSENLAKLNTVASENLVSLIFFHSKGLQAFQKSKHKHPKSKVLGGRCGRRLDCANLTGLSTPAADTERNTVIEIWHINASKALQRCLAFKQTTSDYHKLSILLQPPKNRHKVDSTTPKQSLCNGPCQTQKT